MKVTGVFHPFQQVEVETSWCTSSTS